MIHTLHIEDFRGIRDLSIDRLAPITVFTGDNGVGKTTILEATLALYGRLNPAWLGTLQVRRGFAKLTQEGIDFTGVFKQFNAYGKAVIRATYEDGKSRRVELERRDTETALVSSPSTDSSTFFPPGSADLICRSFEGNRLERETKLVTEFKEDRIIVRPVNPGKLETKAIILHPTDRAAGDEERDRFGDAIVSGRGDAITTGLKLLDKSIEGVQYVTTSKGDYFVVKRKDQQVPLGLLGGGINSLFRFLVNLDYARGGYVGIDEVENGFHHSRHSQLFSVLFDMARLNKTQLFMTTHSGEALKAAVKAAHSTLQDDFAVVHMRRERDKSVAVKVFREHDALASVELGYELR